MEGQARRPYGERQPLPRRRRRGLRERDVLRARPRRQEHVRRVRGRRRERRVRPRRAVWRRPRRRRRLAGLVVHGRDLRDGRRHDAHRPLGGQGRPRRLHRRADVRHVRRAQSGLGLEHLAVGFRQAAREHGRVGARSRGALRPRRVLQLQLRSQQPRRARPHLHEERASVPLRGRLPERRRVRHRLG